MTKMESRKVTRMKTEVKWKTGVHHEKELDGGWMLSFFVFFFFVCGGNQSVSILVDQGPLKAKENCVKRQEKRKLERRYG